MTEANFERALVEWQEVLGGDAVVTHAAVLDRYARSTAPEGTRPAAVLYPESTQQVRDAVCVANRQGVAVYPISRGRNWGYGDACAPTPGAAILDLSGMRRILEINAELGYAVVEPGVSQQELYEAVQREAPQYWVDCTGAGCDASIVGNALERGFGHTPYGDHVRTSCGMEVVLADGTLLQTGFGHFANAQAQHVYPYGVGPYLDGIFTQSNLGIVTRLGVWLYPAPDAFRFFWVRANREDALPELVDALRPLRLRGLLNSAVHIGNDLRIISSLRAYPWEEAGGAAPLPDAVRRRMRDETGAGAWNVSGSLSGTRAQVRHAARALRSATRGLGSVVFLDDRKLALGQRVAGLLGKVGLGGKLRSQLEGLAPNYGLLKGIPTDQPLLGTCWRLAQPPAAGTNPLDANAGLMWMSPVMPLRGADAKAVLDMVQPVFSAHGFDLLATFTMLNERSMVAVLNVSFDKTRTGEADAAQRCYAAVLDALTAAGYPPYRVSPGGMGHITSPDDPFWQTAQALKRALDPNDIIARGRYIPAL